MAVLFLFLQCICDSRLLGRWVWQLFVCFCFCSAFATAGSRLGEVGVAILRLFLFLQCVCDSTLSGRWVWQFFVCFCFCSAFATAGSRGGGCGNSSFVFVSAVRSRQQALGEVGVAILCLFFFLCLHRSERSFSLSRSDPYIYICIYIHILSMAINHM